GGDIVIGVRDRGIGIPEAERRSVGRRFFRASNTRAATGTGLGLYNARKLLEYHQGELSLEVPPDGGTLVLIRLPLHIHSLAPQAGLWMHILHDIVILDIGLPDGNGFDLAAQIRESHSCGINMMTAHGEPDDRCRGYDSGADIYLVKHCSVREIEASIQSLLRRLQNPQAAPGAVPDQWVLNRAS